MFLELPLDMSKIQGIRRLEENPDYFFKKSGLYFNHFSGLKLSKMNWIYIADKK